MIGLEGIFLDCQNDDVEKVKQYIENGGNPNVKDKERRVRIRNSFGDCEDYYPTPLSVAVKSNSLRVVEYLLKNFENLNTDVTKWCRDFRMNQSTSLLHIAMEKRQIPLMKILLEDGRCNGDVGENSMTALFTAVDKADIEMLKLLLAYKNIDVNDRTSWMSEMAEYPHEGGDTALMMAAQLGHLEVVKLLLDDPRVDTIAKSPDNQPFETEMSAVESLCWGCEREGELTENELQILDLLLDHEKKRVFQEREAVKSIPIGGIDEDVVGENIVPFLNDDRSQQVVTPYFIDLLAEETYFDVTSVLDKFEAFVDEVVGSPSQFDFPKWREIAKRRLESGFE